MIYILSHKNYNFPASPNYSVIGLGGYAHLGSENSGILDIELLYPNQYYSELSGLRLLQKEKNDTTVGVCHYRRYFNFLNIKINAENKSGHIHVPMNSAVLNLLEMSEQVLCVEKILSQYDLIVPKAVYSLVNVGVDYISAHREIEWMTFLETLDSYYGHDKHSLRYDKRNFYYNMVIASPEIFNIYCKELFDVIDNVYKKIGALESMPGKRYQPCRYPAYLAERFMTAFINVHKLKYFESDVLITDWD